MLVRSAEDSFRRAREALAEGQGRMALALFEAAIKIERQFRGKRQARYLSYYGLCLAMEADRMAEGIQLCREAVTLESYNPDLHLNLGRVLLRGGRRREAHAALNRGLELEPANPEIRKLLHGMGTRRAPVLPFLPRDNVLNVLLGRVRARTG